MEPGEKMRLGATDYADPDGRKAAAAWLGHVEAGRIGGHLNRPTASLLEAGRLPVNAEARATVLGNERLMFGRQRTIIG